MNKCKKCGHSPVGAYCPVCGERQELPLIQRVSILEKKVERMEGLLKEPSIKRQQEKKRKRTIKKPKVDIEERAEKMLKYVRKHPNEKLGITELHHRVFGKHTSSKIIKALLYRFTLQPIRGVRVKKKGRGFQLQSSRGARKKIDSKKLTERGLWVARKANELMKLGNSRSDAWRKATQEWKQQGEKEKYMLRKKPVVEYSPDEKLTFRASRESHDDKVRFPKIEGVQNKYRGILEEMFKRVVTEGSTLALLDASAIEINKGKDFESFMASLAFHQQEIANYFGVLNKFTFVGGGDDRVLKYG